MPPQLDPHKISIRQFAEQNRAAMIPLNATVAYYCSTGPMSEEDLKEYLKEPVAALPPSIAATLPKLSILLVPYLARKTKASEYVSAERPPASQASPSAQLVTDQETVLAFALKDREMAEYHYRFYQRLSTVLAEQLPREVESRFVRMLRDELTADVHGEVDEASWRIKQTLKRGKSATANRNFPKYAHQSFIDTLTLYLHGICCDIDVDTGPRQLPSRYLRKRLLLMEELFPPPKGYAVFPEQLNA